MNQSFTIFDLHCDTLTASCNCQTPGVHTSSNNSLDDPQHQFALCKVPHSVHWAQCCAIFIPDNLKGDMAIRFYEGHRNSFYQQMSVLHEKVSPCKNSGNIVSSWAQNKVSAILTVENGSVFAGQLDRVAKLWQDGVRMVTLTWNGENELGSGHSTSQGLTPFGRDAVREMEAQGILVDVSHLNDRGFFDLLDAAKKPFVASHSNARAVCSHNRNLTDSQICEMIGRKCLIGLNYYTDFLRSDGQPATLEDLYHHVAHFLELGAEDCLALGSDFDGAEIPVCLDAPEKIVNLDGYFRHKGLSPVLIEKILWRNAMNFFKNNLK